MTKFIAKDSELLFTTVEDKAPAQFISNSSKLFISEEIKVADNQGYEDRLSTNDKSFKKAKEEFASQNEVDNYFKSPEVEDYFNVPEEEKLSKTTTTKAERIFKPYDYQAFNTSIRSVTKSNIDRLKKPWSPTAIPKYRNLILSFGYGDSFTAALLGNSAIETGGTFNPDEQENEKKRNDNSTGLGIFQYTHGVKTEYLKYLKQNKIKNSGWAQIDFMKKYLEGDIKQSNGDSYLGNGTVKELKALVKANKTTTKEWSRIILDILNPLDSARKELERSTISELFYKDMQND